MLNQNDKIERFAEVINKNAEKQCKKIEKQAQEFRKKELGELETQSQNELQSRLDFEKGRIKNETNKKISTMESESKKKISLRRDEIMAEIFSKAEKKLAEFVQSGEYNAFLKNSINNLCDEIEKDVVIYAKESDLQKVTQIASEFSAVDSVKASNEIAIGGVFSSDKAQSVFVYDTLDARLENQREVFKSESGLATV